MRIVLRAALTLVCASFFWMVSAQEAKEFHYRHQGMNRTYWLYMPENLPEDAPLVILLHGYNASAKGYRPEMMEVAREKGFAL